MDTKYENLCKASENAGKNRPVFETKFIDIFSEYLECPEEQITLCISEPNLSADATKFDATLKLTLSDLRILEVSQITFSHDYSLEENVLRYKISFNGEEQFLEKGTAQQILDNIYEELISSLHIKG